MEITEVRIQRLTGSRDDKLKAFATFTIDREFVVRDIKIIEGHNGLFVAMPSRKVTERCASCGTKNPVRSNYCSDCGQKCSQEHQLADNEGRKKFHIDVAHPVSQICREKIHAAIIEAYESSSAAGTSNHALPTGRDG